MSQKKILIVDDDPGFSLFLKDLLGIEGYQTMAAFDAMQAVQFAGRIQPDLILLDINMPAGGGRTVFNRLKQIATTTHIPIIFITGMIADEIQDFVNEKSINSEDVFHKPVDSDRLLQRIRVYLTEENKDD